MRYFGKSLSRVSDDSAFFVWFLLLQDPKWQVFSVRPSGLRSAGTHRVQEKTLRLTLSATNLKKRQGHTNDPAFLLFIADQLEPLLRTPQLLRTTPPPGSAAFHGGVCFHSRDQLSPRRHGLTQRGFGARTTIARVPFHWSPIDV
jgi:hypothetical protein